MKRHLLISIMLGLTISLGGLRAQETQTEPIQSVIERSLALARSQALLMGHNLEGKADALPRTYDKDQLQTCNYGAWVSGFYPGLLWLLYEDSRSNRLVGEDRQAQTDELLRLARLFTERVEPAKQLTNTHDLGFMLYCSFGQGYRITGERHYLDVISEGTQSLLTRWNPRLGVIKSWQTNKRWQYPVIIDNMMNLEMLCFMSHETGDRRYEDIAQTHANTTIKNHFREDYSTFHVVSYDTLTAQPHAKNTAQGYADPSAWARGQSWGLYGYTMMYRETQNPAYLEQARHIASFLTSHPRLPEDKVPFWDYDAPDIPHAQRDASAAAIMASALIELSQLDPSAEAARWLAVAEQQIRTLASPRYLSKPGERGGFLLGHSVGSLPAKSEVDVPLTYADYYFVEALLRLKKLQTRTTGAADRRYWIEQLTRIADPVLTHLAAGTLKQHMPYETRHQSAEHRQVSFLEAVGRTVCGIAPWLELGPDESEEGRLRARYIDLVVRGLQHGVDPQSPDHLTFAGPEAQPLVDAAFLAQGILRAPTQIWGRLDPQTRQRLIAEWKASRSIKPYESNWLLFASMIEAALLEFAGEYDEQRLTYGIKRFRDDWYQGDAWYGDGPQFHLDYYNSLVIHPMLTEVLRVMKRHGLEGADFLPEQERRLGRYASQLERMISPEGTYPVIGRSIAYRCGSLHALADAAWLRLLPSTLAPAQVRCALTAVIRRQLSQPRTFDSQGWLRVGFAGSQPRMGETYINTGSLYLSTAAFLPLGLPENDPFWACPAVPWTSLKAWNGTDVGLDHALH